MNAGIADATNLSWMIAAALKVGRRPHSRRLRGRATADHRTGVALRRATRKDCEAAARDSCGGGRTEPTAIGARRIGEEAWDLDVSAMLRRPQFRIFLRQLPLIAYDGETPPAYTMADFISPRCQAAGPARLAARRAIPLRRVWPDFTLIRFDPAWRSTPCRSGRDSRVPIALSTWPTRGPDPTRATGARATRPACRWRGDEPPAAPLDLIDLVRGARIVPLLHSDMTSACGPKRTKRCDVGDLRLGPESEHFAAPRVWSVN